MLFGKTTKYAAGIFLYGDYHDLYSVNETIHELTEDIDEKNGDFLLGLAYDVRKAYERQRQEIKVGIGEIDKMTYRGVNILWPIFIIQLRLLRFIAGIQPTNKRQQSDIFRLEYCMESALTSYDMKIGNEVIFWANKLSMYSLDYYYIYASQLSAEYISIRGGKTRFKQLPAIIRKLNPIGADYSKFEEMLRKEAEKHNCDPHELQLTDEVFPEIDW